jgi:outer membrane protein assembly factor BamB
MFVFGFATSNSLLACQDWSQWMGADRDNIWRESNILERFPDTGAKVLWRSPIAGGYAGPAVSNGRVYVADYETADNVKVDNFQRTEFSGNERVICLDEATGREVWKHVYPVKYTISYPAGPRCTPLTQDGKVYILGAEGDLFCLDAEQGTVIWSKQLREEYDTKSDLWGYAAHPLIYQNKLITLAGGKGSHVVAFDKDSGAEIWRSSTATSQGYSPPTLIETGGKTQLVLAKPNSVSAIDPQDGKEYWSVPYEATSGSIIMSPVKVGDYLYVAGFNKQSLLLKLKSDTPAVEEVWRNKARSAFSPVNVQPMAIDNVLYGVDQDGQLVALSIPDGERLWEMPLSTSKRPQQSDTAFIVRQADRFWLFNESGELIIARLTAKGYEELDRTQVIKPSNVAFGREVVWSMPAFCNRHAYIRNDREIICVDLSAEAKD